MNETLLILSLCCFIVGGCMAVPLGPIAFWVYAGIVGVSVAVISSRYF